MPLGARSYNVLVAEDEGLIARDIAQRLEALGHKVAAIVSTGEEAVESAPGADVVLMDIRLDGAMDGIEAAQTIRRSHQIPVIFLTAHADRPTLERAKMAQPFGYIVKPVAPAALHTTIEITVYKSAVERELADREAWLAAVLEASPEAVAVASAEGLIRTLNPAAEALTGWAAADAERQPLAKIIPLVTEGAGPVEVPIALAMLRDAAVPLGRKTHLIARGGGSVPVEGSVAPVRSGEKAIGAVVSFRDISERRWEEERTGQVQQVEVAARLASGIAEEYKNLLALIRAQTERLLDSFGDYAPARHPAEEIREAVAAAEQITRRLAGFAKRHTTHPQVLSPNGVLRRMNKLLERVAGDGVKLTTRLGAQAGRILADEGQIEQLLMNVIVHAGRLCPAGGEVRVETEQVGREVEGAPGGYVRIAVGHPVSAPDANVRFDSASAEESLALLLVQSIVSEANGFLSSHRTAEGRACLEILFPRCAEPDAPSERNPGPAMQTILFVEARDAVRAELHKFFETNGFNLLEAADASEAIALAEVLEGPLDLLIASAGETAQIHQAWRELRPGLPTLSIVEGAEKNPGEVRRSYTQALLLARVRALLKRDGLENLSTAAGTL